VEKVLEQLAERNPKSYRIIKRKLQEFAETGRGNVKHIMSGLYRLRGGDWRIYFGRKGDDILITDLILRPQAYRHDVIERAMRRLEMMTAQSNSTRLTKV
jgi:putative component of toxin-antitoxin plasmid stabilization module